MGDRIRGALPDPAYRFTAVVVAAGGGLVAALAARGGFSSVEHPSIRLVLFVLLAATGELWLMRLPSRVNWTVISASSLFTYSTVLAFGAGPAIVGLCAGTLIKDLRDRRPAVKVAFNVGQHALTVGAGAGVFELLGGHVGRVDATGLPGVVCGGLTFLVVNSLLTGTVVALASGSRIATQIRQNLGAWLLIEGVMLGFAPVAVVATDRTLWLLPMLALPFLGVRQSARIAMRSEHAALHDALTGLPNRVLFRMRVEQALERRHVSGTEVVVMMLDLDRFKEVNDTLGHGRGDELLCGIAERLRNSLRDADIVARLGGDEFGVLIRFDRPDRPKVIRLAERIRDALEPPFPLGDLWVDAGASIGIAAASLHGGDPETLVQRADVAMYLAKQSGSGFELYDLDRDPNAPDRLAMIQELRQGIADDQLVLHYQPKIDVQTGAVLGAEALVRWQHPTRGLLAPGEFIELAERTDAVRALTLDVLRKALRQVAAWEAEGLSVPVAVNLSARVLMDVALPADIEHLLVEAGVDPRYLEVELTESSLVVDPERTAEILGRVNRAGVRVAIDDFGTGYSSLVLLRRLPVDAIKIDRSFVGGMTDSGEDAAIVASTLRLAESLGIDAVAEGVEDAETMDRLRLMGCRQAQGYHIFRPQPPELLGEWLRGRARAEAAAAV